MSLQRGESFFEALFGFKEKDYISTRHQLFQRWTFEAQQRSTSAGAQKVFKERALFEHPLLGKRHLVSSGWHSTPSVAELRAETTESVCTFEERCPGLLASLRKTPPKLQGEAEASKACTPEKATNRLPSATSMAPWVQCSHTTGESGALHLRYPNAFFQVASQFNSLEFISPDMTPEDGVTHYVHDHTQGPACALACMAGTAYRNYLLHPDLFNSYIAQKTEVGEQQRGQQTPHQLNLLDCLTSYLTQGGASSAASTLPKVDVSYFYRIQNGYFHPTPFIGNLTGWLESMASSRGTTLADVEEALISRLRVALVEDVTVTLPLHNDHKDNGDVVRTVHEVSQSYNSALSLPPPPPSTKRNPDDAWAGMESLSRIILCGTYEATLLACVQHTLRSLERQSKATPATHFDGVEGTLKFTLPPIFLTKVGGGVFNNDAAWIAAAIESAVHHVASFGVPLDVRLVHYRAVDPYYAQYLSSWPMRKSM